MIGVVLAASRRHPLLVTFVCGLAAAVFVFRAELLHAVLVFVSGVLAWRLLLGRAGVRRRRRGPSWLAGWVEAASMAWIAAHVGGQPRDRSLRAAAATPIGSLLPVYRGARAPADRPPPVVVDGQGDEIPF